MSERESLWDRHYFLIRRLHSLSGIVPIGAFLIAHLTTNSTLLWGALNSRASEHASDATGRAVATFQDEVTFINEMPMLMLIEWTLWGAIAFHVVLGVYFAMSGKRNTRRYSYQGNRRYALQRVSGYFGVLFIFYHVATLRWGWTFLVPGGTEWSHHWAASTLAACIQGGWDGVTPMGFVVALFYFVGVSLLVFHFANGLWTAAITWGLTVTIPAQQRWGRVCFGLGAVMMLMGWASIWGAVRLDPTDAYFVEESTHGEVVPEAPAFMRDGSHDVQSSDAGGS